MSKTKKIAIVVSLVVILAVIVVGAFFIFYRGNTYGITHGTYAPIDDNGKILDVKIDRLICIKKDGVELGYATDKLITESDKIYYYNERTIGIDKYEMSYDKKTKILTVYMPEKLGDGEIKEWKFK